MAKKSKAVHQTDVEHAKPISRMEEISKVDPILAALFDSSVGQDINHEGQRAYNLIVEHPQTIIEIYAIQTYSTVQERLVFIRLRRSNCT